MPNTNKEKFLLSLTLIGATTTLAGVVVSSLLIVRINSGNTSFVDEQLSPANNPYGTLLKQNVSQQMETSRRLMMSLDPIKIRENLLKITTKVHVAGTDDQLRVMDFIANYYTSIGLQVRVHDYKVLLSYPDYANPNTVHMRKTECSQSVLVSSGLSETLGPPEAMEQQNDKRVVYTFSKML